MLITVAERMEVIDRLNELTAIPIYANLPLHLQEDEEIAVAAAKRDGLMLAHAPLTIRKNLRVVQAAVRNTALAKLHTPLTVAEPSYTRLRLAASAHAA